MVESLDLQGTSSEPWGLLTTPTRAYRPAYLASTLQRLCRYSFFGSWLWATKWFLNQRAGTILPLMSHSPKKNMMTFGEVGSDSRGCRDV